MPTAKQLAASRPQPLEFTSASGRRSFASLQAHDVHGDVATAFVGILGLHLGWIVEERAKLSDDLVNGLLGGSATATVSLRRRMAGRHAALGSADFIESDRQGEAGLSLI